MRLTIAPVLPLALLSGLALLAPPQGARAETALPDPAATETGAAVLPAITVSPVARRVLRDRVIASGLIGPVEEVRVQPLTEGQPIEALLADVGDRVAAGQVLARLSPSTLQLQRSQLDASLAQAVANIAQGEAQLVEATASADEAKRVSDRNAALKDQNIVSQAVADQAQAAYAAAAARATAARQALIAAQAQAELVRAQIANIELELSRTEVKSPVAGEVAGRNAVIGAVATATGAPMFTLIRDGALELRADVAEGDLIRLAPGQTARVTATGGSAPLTGHVRLVEPVIDTTTRLGRARIAVDDASAVRSGMFADAEILIAEREILAVPISAVGAQGGAASVMRVRDGKVARTPVTTGIRDGGLVEITSGLDEGDLVVTKAGSFVRDGDRINPVPAATN